MGKRDVNKKGTMEEPTNEEIAENSPVQTQGNEANANPQAHEAASLARVLEEIRDFRQDAKQQLSDIKSELTNINHKIAEAETRIEKTESRVQNVEQVLDKLIKVVTQQENKLLDQEGRSRRENLRIYNVTEGEEGSSMVEFIESFLRQTLELPMSTQLEIEREEILRKAWGKKRVLWNGRPIYLDQDYRPAILQKRREYSEAKRVLKERGVRYQTPFPAKLRVFYEDGTPLYHTAEEATTDMKDRGFPVKVTTSRESLAEQLSRSTWTTVGELRKRRQTEERESNIRERLRTFRRQTSAPLGE
ncbi:hypothetical protein SRHO_G00074780 [Serrasalmus rhombeus]